MPLRGIFTEEAVVDEDGTMPVSFIVRIWFEEAAQDGGPVWRGSITYVPSGEKHYFASFSRLTHYIALRLDKVALGSDQVVNTASMPEGDGGEEG